MSSFRKKSFALFLSGFLSISVFASGYPVFDFQASMNAMNQIFRMYDQINATIETVQNGYKQLEQAYQQAKGLFEGGLQLQEFGDDWWKNIGTLRDNYKNTNRYISSKIDRATAIKNKTQNIKWFEVDGEKFTTKDLLGFHLEDLGDRDGDGNYNKSIVSDGGFNKLFTAHKNFTAKRAKSIQHAYMDKLTDKERKEILRESGYTKNSADIIVSVTANEYERFKAAEALDFYEEEVERNKKRAEEAKLRQESIEAAEKAGTEAALQQTANTLAQEQTEKISDVSDKISSLGSFLYYNTKYREGKELARLKEERAAKYEATKKQNRKDAAVGSIGEKKYGL